jgi:hypothetical protein
MNVNLHNITNHFQDVHLVSLSSWRQANEIFPRDRHGPYVVLQEGYDPADYKMRADEFILGRSGKWLALGWFYRMPVPERRAEFVFGTVSEVMQMMGGLPSKVAMFDHAALEEKTAAEHDPMMAAIEAGRKAAGSG